MKKPKIYTVNREGDNLDKNPKPMVGAIDDHMHVRDIRSLNATCSGSRSLLNISTTIVSPLNLITPAASTFLRQCAATTISTPAKYDHGLPPMPFSPHVRHRHDHHPQSLLMEAKNFLLMKSQITELKARPENADMNSSSDGRDMIRPLILGNHWTTFKIRRMPCKTTLIDTRLPVLRFNPLSALGGMLD